MSGSSLLTAFNFKRARLCVEGKSAKIHIAHCSHCNPRNKKTRTRFSEDAKYKCGMLKQTEKASVAFQYNCLLLITHKQCVRIQMSHL